MLIIGDLVVYLFSLIITLAVRYGEIPGRSLFLSHLTAFAILSLIYLLINFSAGLYDKQSLVIRGRIPSLLVKVQIINALVGAAFFYLALVSIAPKANLFIYFIVSTLSLFLWRIVMFPVLSVTRKQNAIILGSGIDLEDLDEEIGGDARYGLIIKDFMHPKDITEETNAAISIAVKNLDISVIIADLRNPAIESSMPFLYSLVFSGVQVMDASRLYEAVFDRIPLSMAGERWLVENSATALGHRMIYDVLKRSIDVAVSFVAGVISLISYPFIFAAIKIEDGGPAFISQDRIGKKGNIVRIFKFRSMSGNDQGKYGKNGSTQLVVTRVGKFIRSTRLDEIPQLWNVFRGDLSLIGPRPEFPALVAVYEKEIPYYNARLLVKPGLSGWAQIYHKNHPHHGADPAETRNKLCYDLYYVKNRSFMLDIKIALRTLQILLQRLGK